eukprot:scaffold1697_cov120-Cylindrotheca_fusiformis.AAC.26
MYISLQRNKEITQSTGWAKISRPQSSCSKRPIITQPSTHQRLLLFLESSARTLPTFLHMHHEMTDTAAIPKRSPVPAVLACGYRQIKIPKTGSTFPAFLVSLPSHVAWRSKRDFLQLGRHGIPLPKSALKKLAESTPWRAPTDLDPDQQPNHYHPRMKKSLSQLDRFLETIASSSDSNTKRAWELFCRPGDTEGLVAMTDHSKELHPKQNAIPSQTSEQKSSELGQYFCSKENAKKLVSCIIQKCHHLLFQDDDDIPIWFLEPSCGHGDVIQELIRQFDDLNVSPDRVSIRCYDIDPNAIRACKQKISVSKFKIIYTCQNFLSTKLEVDTFQPQVFCLGGPPYTSGAGGSSDIRRDLPNQFIEHCLQEFKASIVCFLLPIRYREYHKLEGFEQQTMELKSSTFFFQGVKRVIQPSIIKCIYESSTASVERTNLPTPTSNFP